MAAIGWVAAVTTLDAGELLASGGEWGMLRLGASLARDIPAGLGDAVTWIDPGNAIPFSRSNNVRLMARVGRWWMPHSLSAHGNGIPLPHDLRRRDPYLRGD